MKHKPDKQKIKDYANYSGMAYQLFGLLFISVFVGMKADAYFNNDQQYITAGLCLVSLFGYFYKIAISTKKD